MTDSLTRHPTFETQQLPRTPGKRLPAFRWSWKLATVSGLDVYVDGTFRDRWVAA